MIKRLAPVAIAASLLVSGCDGLLNQVAANALKQIGQTQGKTPQQQPAQQPQQQPQQPPQQQPQQPPAGAPTTAAVHVGQKWVYGMTIKAAGTTTEGELTNEVTAVNGDTMSITTSVKVAGLASTSSTKQVKLTSPDPYASLAVDGSATVTPTVTDESVTVPAGTFAARKSSYTTKKDNADMTVDAWTNKDLGLLKYVTTVKPTVALPAGLPGGFDLSNTTTVVLKSYTK